MQEAARDAVTQRHVSGLIHREAAHPTVVAVGRVRALLKHRQARPRSCHTELIPADAHAASCHNAVIDDQRFVIPEVSVGEPIHEPVAKRIEPLRRAALWDAPSAAARLRVRCCGERHWPREAAAGRRRPIHMELPKGKRVRSGTQADNVVW